MNPDVPEQNDSVELPPKSNESVTPPVSPVDVTITVPEECF
jgi:hypothetical protein